MSIAASQKAAALSNSELFFLSATGGLVTAILIFVLPELHVAWRAGNLRNWTKTKFWLTPVLLILYSAFGGLGAFILGDRPSTIRGALLAGIKAPTLIKAAVAAGREATSYKES